MSQRKRLKKPKVKGAERRRAARQAEAEPASEDPRDRLQLLRDEWEQRSRELLREAAQDGARLYALVAELRALPQRRHRKRESLLKAARREQRNYRSQLQLWLDIYGKAAVPESTQTWLAEDLKALREEIEAEQRRQTAAEESSMRFAEELRPRYRIGDDHSFQEFAKRFIYDQ
ncbi:hypothetical protein O1R50_08190 [Glycomyces luteolus]|uniref:Uncharacterized protein n=1 Tax=Glycomyces luteolus TaxID=2670330 RepID=A0A9X3P692_9ACTN|nr:hypothetical protein [Glycomyces luteolus]MDA1359598.1 hypothetical protein [Glycomyces luteolus]